ncbi:hypothetical protein NP493_217g05018 [Ridgeia piscesae]|uniref:Uncharacterized protein n=1 Tax=Ridgeia piscesae TaxID=27915 RepID=A0AAD9P0T8_RIDPI|nr:hypothetical protein NP493_217g05018 [Ridgeia piscesae]
MGTLDTMDDFGYVLVILVIVLAALTAIFGLVYAWIYFTKIRPRPKAPPEDQRISHFQRKPGGSFKNQDKKKKATHPFFIMSAVNKMKTSGNQNASSSRMS